MSNKTQITNTISRKIIECVKSCIEENKGKTLELMDGSLVRLSPETAQNFIVVHDQLAETSQQSFRLMLVENKKTFEGVITFCKERKQ